MILFRQVRPSSILIGNGESIQTGQVYLEAGTHCGAEGRGLDEGAFDAFGFRAGDGVVDGGEVVQELFVGE